MPKNADKMGKNATLCRMHRIKTLKIGKKTKRKNAFRGTFLQNVYIFAI